MELDVTLHVQAPEWKTALRPYGKTVRDTCALALAETRLARLPCHLTMAVVLADDAFVRELNHTYRGKDKATNVLSFPSMPDLERQAAKRCREQPELELGDIVLSYATVATEAKTQDKSFRHHAMHLLVHGMLHLLGYEHEDAGQAATMERKEIKILKKLDIKNPYL